MVENHKVLDADARTCSLRKLRGGLWGASKAVLKRRVSGYVPRYLAPGGLGTWGTWMGTSVRSARVLGHCGAYSRHNVEHMHLHHLAPLDEAGEQRSRHKTNCNKRAIGVLWNEEWLCLAVARFGCLLPLWNECRDGTCLFYSTLTTVTRQTINLDTNGMMFSQIQSDSETSSVWPCATDVVVKPNAEKGQ